MVDVRRLCDRLMTVVVFEEDVLRLICRYALQSGRRLKKTVFHDDLKGEWDMHSAGDYGMCLGDFNGRHIYGFDGVHGGYGVGLSYLEGRMLLELYLEKELCVSNTWLKREEKRKVTFRMDENETEIDIVLTKKEHKI